MRVTRSICLVQPGNKKGSNPLTAQIERSIAHIIIIAAQRLSIACYNDLRPIKCTSAAKLNAP